MAFKMSHGVSWHLSHEVVDTGAPQHEHLYSFLGTFGSSALLRDIDIAMSFSRDIRLIGSLEGHRTEGPDIIDITVSFLRDI